VHVCIANDPDDGLDADAWNGGGVAVPHFHKPALRQAKGSRFARGAELLAFVRAGGSNKNTVPASAKPEHYFIWIIIYGEGALFGEI
jgi:hypothetical protein